MNNKAFTLSLAAAVAAVFFVWSYVSTIEEESRRKFGTEVVVLKAKRDIKEMETLTETAFEFDAIPKRFLDPAGISFEDGEKAKESRIVSKLTGSVAMVPIKKGEQITYNKLSEPSLRTGLAPQITPGKRAVSLQVGETTGVGKLLKPGDRVDLVVVIDTGGGKLGKVVKTVLQDVVVLATGRAVTNNVPRLIEPDPFSGKDRVRSLAEDFSYSSVTLEVEPVQAQMVALVTSNPDNVVTLSLRNNEDTDRVTVEAMNFEDALGTEAMTRGQRGLASGRR